MSSFHQRPCAVTPRLPRLDGVGRRGFVRLAAGLCAATAFAYGPTALAADLKIMISGGFKGAYTALQPAAERAVGERFITIGGASMGATPTAIPNRLARGEEADVVILARESLDRLVAQGLVLKGSEVDLVRSRIGVAVRAGAPEPRISTVKALRRTLLRAKSIAYSDSASGVYVSGELFKRLGVAEKVAGKATMVPGTPVGETIARGEAELGFQQISELLPVRGIKIVGPIPEAVQKVTVFSAGVVATSKSPDQAKQLIAYLHSPAARAAIEQGGLEHIQDHDK